MSTNFTVTTQQIIDSALRIIGVEGLTQTMEPQWYTNASLYLNMMIKSWMAKGVTLFKIKELIVTLQSNVNNYQLGPSALYITDINNVAVTDRPQKVVDQGNFVRIVSTNSDTPITLLGRDEYETYGVKTSQGVVNSIFYDPQEINGVLFVYPAPADTTRVLHIFVQMPYTDINNLTDNFDFPQEWYNALRWGLAREMMAEVGVDQQTESRIERHYAESITDVFNYSVDEATVYFTYDSRQTR